MAIVASQSHREIEVLSPLGKDVFLFRDLLVDEGLSQLTEMHLRVLSLENAIQPGLLLGQPLAIRLDLPNYKQRYFHGLVTQFQHEGTQSPFTIYSITLQPWLWFLGLRTNCRIFQDIAVPDLIKELFREHGFCDFKDKLRETYPLRRYCVQYRESDLHFVKRLMEQEGIYFYFEYSDEAHHLVLTDAICAHCAIPHGYDRLPYRPLTQRDHREEHISSWQIARNAQPGHVTLQTFDFKKPQANLEVRATRSVKHAHAKLERYDYAGDYYDSADGERLARIRIEALHAQSEYCSGEANTRGLTVGGLFKLEDHPRSDQNREYLVIRASHHLQGNAYQSQGSRGGTPVYYCEFRALDSRIPYRAPLQTLKPLMPGPETAIVVGPTAQEIWTDKHGRIKVQFHWDRVGKFDENSSCWIRVSQPWAGRGWGSVAIPRVGQEVVVDFLQGDPDRPLVMGRVFNALQSPPYALPHSAHMMGFRSSSTPGGEGYCEMVIHDCKGAEKIVLHTQRDLETTVLNDDMQTVHRDRRITVNGRHEERIKGDISVTSSEQRIVLTAATEIILQVGRSRIVLRDGSIDICGPLAVNINA